MSDSIEGDQIVPPDVLEKALIKVDQTSTIDSNLESERKLYVHVRARYWEGVLNGPELPESERPTPEDPDFLTKLHVVEEKYSSYKAKAAKGMIHETLTSWYRDSNIDISPEDLQRKELDARRVFAFGLANIEFGFITNAKRLGVPKDKYEQAINEMVIPEGIKGGTGLAGLTEIDTNHYILEVSALAVSEEWVRQALSEGKVYDDKTDLSEKYPLRVTAFETGVEESSHLAFRLGIHPTKIEPLDDLELRLVTGTEHYSHYIATDVEFIGMLDQQYYAPLLGYPNMLQPQLERACDIRKQARDRSE